MKISVVIPTFNRISLVARAIDSVLKQSLNPYEIIVVDDGSDDGTSEMIQNKYKSIKLIQQQNNGVSAARNNGIKHAKGDWIGLLDSDDEWTEKKLENQVDRLIKTPEYDFCHTNEIWIRNGVRVNQRKKHEKYGGYIFDKCLDICRISPSSVLFRKNILDHVGWFDDQLPVCEDYDLWLRITAEYRILFIDDPLIIKYGGHDDQLSHGVEGIEFFRIKSLENLLERSELSTDNRILSIQMIIKKYNIYLNGLVKRKKQGEADQIKEKIKFWKKDMIEY
jgi:glycosyltransferase involved in cell wall biosynthesis